jgi:hypothetical protein
LERKKWRYTCRLFRTNCLKEGAVWHVDPLLGSNCEMGDYTAAVARQQPTNNNKGMVFSVRSMPRGYMQDELVVILERLDAKMN